MLFSATFKTQQMNSGENQVLPITMDIEASGLGRNSYPIEIAFVMPDGEQHDYLIKPPAAWDHWDARAESLHGITRDKLQREGFQPWDIASEMNDLLAGKTVYSDAWGNDMPWVARIFEAASLPQLFQINAITSLLPPRSLERWSGELSYQHSQLNRRRHRALTDAIAIQRAFAALTEEDALAEFQFDSPAAAPRKRIIRSSAAPYRSKL